MSTAEKVLVIAVFASVAWLAWSGRANSPRKKGDRARWDYLLEQAIRDKPTVEINEPADENDVARIVGRDLSPEARRLANGDGWADHARMHPDTAADYEARAALPG